MADKENLTTTWSSRNPTLPTQLPRQRTTSTPSGPAAATQAARRQSKKEKEARLNTAIEVLVQTCEETIEQLSKDFDLDATKVRSMVTHATTLKKPRKPNLHNAKLFHKRKELEQDGASPKRLSELRRLVEEDDSLKTENLSRAQKKDLCNALMVERALKSTGTRATMRATTLDASLNTSHITSEMHNMFLRTGVRSMIFFARSHTDDRFISTFYAVDEVTERFLPDILKLDAGNVTRKFELYTCAEEKSAMKTESLESLRVEISLLIIEGLRTITGDKRIKMKYREYDSQIVAEHHVQIVGWPSLVPFRPPSKLCIKDDARTLRNALVDGICRWETLTREQRESHKERMVDIRAARASTGTKRKERSDKGKQRGPSKKKQRSGQLPPSYKSKAIIDDESSGSDESSSGSDEE
ncbi:hypothetical protein H0H93_000604 [Arthromyces matolae]|nr:hypothetical protein H0H93_000604 [Arthromyces matolae]